uniref:Interleukin-17 receptor D n=1 Tax=Callorhinchus milii TaxID=7868 RepID=A0A4W3H0P4_CALMI
MCIQDHCTASGSWESTLILSLCDMYFFLCLLVGNCAGSLTGRCGHPSLLTKNPVTTTFIYIASCIDIHPGWDLRIPVTVFVITGVCCMCNGIDFKSIFLSPNTACENLLKRDNLACRKYWSPKNLSVTQPYQSTDLNVTFDPAPLTYGFKAYHIRCKMVNTVFHKDKNISVVRETHLHFPWAGPIRAIAITVPLVVVSAIVTLLTVLCCKKQQSKNLYSELDEENSETSPSPRSKPKVFICYSSKDGHRHLSVVQCFAFFLQDFCGCEVILDLWEHLEICKEGQMDWLNQQIRESHYVIVICSKGMKYFVEKKHRKHKGGLRDGRGELFIVAVSMIAERLRQARLNSANTSKFIALYFDYSCEADIPGVLDLAYKYKLMEHFPQLYSHLHARDHSGAEREPHSVHISKSNYFRSRSGRSLYIAICNMKQLMEQEPDWFQKQLMPTVPSLAHHRAPVRVDSGLVLNEVVFKQPVTEHDFHLKTIADVTPTTLGSHPIIIQHLSICGDLDIAEQQDARSLLRPLPQRVEAISLTLPEMPRDSGIYDSSIPSSELSLPLMDGLCSDQTETYSIADSVSSSSGLGEEDPPVLMAPKSAVSEVCKVELDKHIHSVMVSL